MLDRTKINRVLFLAALVVECILVGMLIYGKITSDRLISLPLSAEDASPARGGSPEGSALWCRPQRTSPSAEDAQSRRRVP